MIGHVLHDLAEKSWSYFCSYHRNIRGHSIRYHARFKKKKTYEIQYDKSFLLRAAHAKHKKILILQVKTRDGICVCKHLAGVR